MAALAIDGLVVAEELDVHLGLEVLRWVGASGGGTQGGLVALRGDLKDVGGEVGS